MKSFIIFCFILVLLSGDLYSSGAGNYTKNLNLGIGAGLNINMHSPSFSHLYAGDFSKNSNDFGFHFNGIINYPLNNYYILSGRIGYNDCMGQIEGVYLDDTAYAYDASLKYFEISPVMQFHNLFPIEPLYLLGGLELGIPIGTNEIENTNKSMGGATYEITDASFRAAIAVGAGYVFPISRHAYLTPEISFRFPFTGVSSHDNFDSWSVPQLRLGVSLTFDFADDDGGESYRSELDAGFREVRYYDKEGNFYPLETIRVEETQYQELFPLVSSVFFEENKSQPSAKLQILNESSEAGVKTIANMEPDALKINMKTLDIIGERMLEFTKAKLSIKGTIDSKNEQKKLELANARAEFAKNYLVNRFKIDPSRITLLEGGFPSKPSSSKIDDGVAENRRVEFSSDDERILKPIIIKGDRQSIAQPDIIEFVPYAESTDSITNWKLEISRADKTLRTIQGTGEPHPVKWLIYPNELENNEIPLEYYLYVKNSFGLEAEENGTVPVEYYSFTRKQEEKLPDRTISKFSLILFDFDKSDISELDMKIITENVIPAIKYNSTVKIYGYTDRIGSPDYNKELAKKRADAVKTILENAVKDAKYEVYGVGFNKGLFDNDIPIGRHLSRTVQVFVETPR